MGGRGSVFSGFRNMSGGKVCKLWLTILRNITRKEFERFYSLKELNLTLISFPSILTVFETCQNVTIIFQHFFHIQVFNSFEQKFV